MPPKAARSRATSPEEPEIFVPVTFPLFRTANSMETLPFLVVSGTNLCQFSLTLFSTDFRYGPKSTPFVSLSTSIAPNFDEELLGLWDGVCCDELSFATALGSPETAGFRSDLIWTENADAPSVTPTRPP